MSKEQQTDNAEAASDAAPAGSPTGNPAADWAELLWESLGMGFLGRLQVLPVAKLHKKNVDTLVEVSRLAMSGALQVAECQHKILLEGWAELSSSRRTLMEVGFSGAVVTAQAESAKLASERFLSDTRTLISLLTRTNADISGAVRNRLVEMAEEISQLVSRSEVQVPARDR